HRQGHTTQSNSANFHAIRRGKIFSHVHDAKRRAFGRNDCRNLGYHLITPFCQTSTRSRTVNNAVMMIKAAKTFPYSAQPCAQLTYQPRPDLTPTVSATMSVRKEVPNPMNKPMKMLGIAAGIATRKIRYFCPAPSVRATSR